VQAEKLVSRAFLVLFWGGPAKKEPRREGNSKTGGAAATALCFSLAIAGYYKAALLEEFRPFGPNYFWAKAAKSKQKPLVKRL
jgi:hypothetical protein